MIGPRLRTETNQKCMDVIQRSIQKHSEDSQMLSRQIDANPDANYDTNIGSLAEFRHISVASVLGPGGLNCTYGAKVHCHDVG